MWQSPEYGLCVAKFVAQILKYGDYLGPAFVAFGHDADSISPLAQMPQICITIAQ